MKVSQVVAGARPRVGMAKRLRLGGGLLPMPDFINAAQRDIEPDIIGRNALAQLIVRNRLSQTVPRDDSNCG